MRSKKKSTHSSNLRKNNHLSTKTLSRIDITAEPKVLYEPNITTDSEDVNVSIVSEELKLVYIKSCLKLFFQIRHKNLNLKYVNFVEKYLKKMLILKDTKEHTLVTNHINVIN